MMAPTFLMNEILYADVTNNFRSKNYEKEPSTRDRSVREMKYGPRHIRHRFPIKGGLSLSDMFAINIEKNNILLERLIKRRSSADDSEQQ